MIQGYQNFTYVGYTYGGGLPTYYFVEGRYTQQHSKPENVGWHPVKAGNRRANISKANHDAYKEMTDQEKADFKADFMLGDYDDNVSQDGKLFECHPSGASWIAHPSRGRLMTPGMAGFDDSFNQQAAMAILASPGARLAPNEG